LSAVIDYSYLIAVCCHRFDSSGGKEHTLCIAMTDPDQQQILAYSVSFN
jgi:hypothetical protein